MKLLGALQRIHRPPCLATLPPLPYLRTVRVHASNNHHDALIPGRFHSNQNYNYQYLDPRAKTVPYHVYWQVMSEKKAIPLQGLPISGHERVQDISIPCSEAGECRSPIGVTVKEKEGWPEVVYDVVAWSVSQCSLGSCPPNSFQTIEEILVGKRKQVTQGEPSAETEKNSRERTRTRKKSTKEIHQVKR